VIAISDWYGLIGGLSLLLGLALLVFLAWWALYSDRPADRRRCPRCWHDLRYTQGLMCTECGFNADAEADLRRVRRRWPLATFAILGCVAIGLFLLDRVHTRGWVSYVPTRVLLAALPLAGDANGLILSDLQRRIRAGDLDHGHWITLLERCRVGDGSARPPTDAWIAKYGRHLDAAEKVAAHTNDDEWRSTLEQLLLDVPPRVDLRARSVWPARIAPTVDILARSWWPRRTQWRIRAEPKVAGARAVEHVLLDDAIQRRSCSLPLPVLSPGRHEVPVELTISRRAGPDAEWETFEPQTRAVAINVSDEASATLEPITDDATDEAIRSVFAGGLAKFRGGSLPVRINVRIRQTFSAIFEDTAVGLRVEVFRNGKRGRQLDMWWLAGAGDGGWTSAWEVPWHDDEVLGAPASPDDVWTIRARGDLELALRVNGASKYWAGDVTVDVPIRFQNDQAPDRGWISWEEAQADEQPR